MSYYGRITVLSHFLTVLLLLDGQNGFNPSAPLCAEHASPWLGSGDARRDVRRPHHKFSVHRGRLIPRQAEYLFSVSREDGA